eukprot:scaffold16878_cov32-Prasinocladus_malaysianus.AAC.1
MRRAPVGADIPSRWSQSAPQMISDLYGPADADSRQLRRRTSTSTSTSTWTLPRARARKGSSRVPARIRATLSRFGDTVAVLWCCIHSIPYGR